ncbi:MAG: chromosome segregation protein SMC [Lachnospiraceae bacterium]|nr:chromosome segregation protein SMC [Lachnospiraceae bacterium]
MYLKSIEVHGFKSFANKIHFQFHNGITGIVGPNGSGKSNVADAVRWVLGEQRIKQLRGASMQDVIFSGTELRKPLGYAYVAITLDNSDHSLAIDYDEVTVARRLYRSGESEYLINGTPCRLKDVNELFYDTGIGKEGYSIIGQGQIDKILSGKPEERRELFDEAAGIVKFKRRKDAAVKKLESEKQNLTRVTDILSELEKQVGPLEKQSEKAKIYLKKKEELKTLDVNVFLLESTRIREQLALVEEKYTIASGDLSQTTAKYEGIREEYERIQAEIEHLEKEMEEARAQLTDTSVLRGKLEGEIAVLKEQINSVRGNEQHLKSRRETLQQEIDSRNAEMDQILEEKKEFDEHFEQLNTSREEAQNKLNEVQNRITELNSSIESGKNTIIDTLNQRAAIKSRMGRFDTMQEQVQIRRAELNSRLLRAKSDEVEQEENIKALETAFEEVNAEIARLNDSQTGMEEKLSELREMLAKKDKKLRDTQVLYHQDKSKLDALNNLTERYEGYGGSVKRVMEQKDHTKGIIGVVADIIKVDKKYETAIETALGGSIQNVVTEDEETAKKMIAYLKQSRGGRATFLPLTSIKNAQEFKQKEVLSEKGVLGLAHHLVTTESAYADVAKSLLGRIIVVDQVDNAVRLAKKYSHTLRIVTLEGELLVPGGAISGGAFKNSSNLLGRRREMEELENKVKKTLQEIDALLDDIEQTKKLRNRMRMDLEESRAKLQEAFIRQNTARLNVLSAQEKKSQTEAGFDSLKKEEEEIENQVQEIKKEKETIVKELAESERLEKSVEEQISVFQEELDKRRREESSQTASLNERELEVEKIRQQLGFYQKNIDRIAGEIQRYTAELEEVLEKIKTGQEGIEDKEKNIAEIQKTIAASHTSQNDAQNKLNADTAKKDELSAKQKNFFAEREELSGRMSALDKEVYRLNAQKERLEESIESQINYMWNEYEITLSDAASLRDETMTDLAEMKRSTAAVKDAIRKLGDVNVNAIEDYKNLMERYTFLKTQHDDLVEAEKTLTNIITELDSAMRRQFKEKFAEIGREFDKVFKELFGGGKGTLELMEDEDILEAGIRIIAQPPGKKLQNMMQLSGGEKALTAISLLFAIQNLKPSPFCLLDEIEAALDDSNVGRYAKYLHKLTAHTQFIVITHRRGTMEAADRLYGITMQEKGVSTLVSVNLIDKDLTD